MVAFEDFLTEGERDAKPVFLRIKMERGRKDYGERAAHRSWLARQGAPRNGDPPTHCKVVQPAGVLPS